MWKIILAFVAFVALALFALMKGGGNIDMSGEKHSVEAHPPAAASAPAAGASEAAPAAPAAASAAAPAASK